MPKKPERILVEGFLIDVYAPSKALFEVKLDLSHIPRNRYMDVKEKLEDLLREIDEKYAKRRLPDKARMIHVGYASVKDEEGKVRRIRVGVVKPYPSRFPNILGTLRDKLYTAVNVYCKVIERALERKVYLLPLSDAPKFFAEVNKLNEEVESLQKMINEFEKTKDFENICKYLGEIDGRWRDREIHTSLHKIRVYPFLLRLEPVLFERYLDEVSRKYVEKIKEKGAREVAKKAVETMKEELQTQTQEMVNGIVVDVKRRLGGVLQQIYIRYDKLDGMSFKIFGDVVKDILASAESIGLKDHVESYVSDVYGILNGLKEKKHKIVLKIAEKYNIKETNPKEALKGLAKAFIGG